MKNRQLTIGMEPRKNVMRKVRWTPAIRLAGNWLEAAGFTPGEMVDIIVSNGSINIKTR